MQKAMCHYSFHRRWAAENWDTDRLCEETKALGVDAIDFHARLMGDPGTAADRIKASLEKSGLILSGLSLSTNFNIEDADEMKAMIDNTIVWMRIATEIGAPVSRIFGGGLAKEKRTDPQARKAVLPRIVDALAEVTKEAEQLGLILALENHGGLPCTGEEQVDVIRAIGSPNLKATIDVGNYMAGGQEGADGTRVAASCCAYVHFKDYKKAPSDATPWGWDTEPCTVGQGDVDHLACLKILKDAGYDGFVALEYEGKEDERTGVPASVRFMDEVMAGF